MADEKEKHEKERNEKIDNFKRIWKLQIYHQDRQIEFKFYL